MSLLLMVDSETLVFEKGVNNERKSPWISFDNIQEKFNRKQYTKHIFMENTSFTSLDVSIIFKCSNCEQKCQETICIHDTCRALTEWITLCNSSSLALLKKGKTKTHTCEDSYPATFSVTNMSSYTKCFSIVTLVNN